MTDQRCPDCGGWHCSCDDAQAINQLTTERDALRRELDESAKLLDQTANECLAYEAENEQLRRELDEVKAARDSFHKAWAEEGDTAQQLRAEVERLRAEVEHWKAQNQQTGCVLDGFVGDLQRCEQRLHAAVAALRKYGHHVGCADECYSYSAIPASCDRWVSAPTTDTGQKLDHSIPCSCGLHAALEAAGGGEE